MENIIEKFVEGLEYKQGAKKDTISIIEEELGLTLPYQYKDFLLYRNGLEGLVQNSFYISLWPIEELKTLNESYSVEEFAPGLLLFGSDGGGEAYAFDTRNSIMPIVSIPFIPMDLRDIIFISHTFDEFMKYVLSAV